VVLRLTKPSTLTIPARRATCSKRAREQDADVLVACIFMQGATDQWRAAAAQSCVWGWLSVFRGGQPNVR
jgi:hypothetical protein